MFVDERGRREVAGIRVFVTKPPRAPQGLTFLLTAANVPVDNYNSIRDALLEIDHVVVGYYINIASPPWRNNRIKAQNVYDMWQELREEFKTISKYHIVGHSVGGKISLLVAALHNDDRSLRAIVALDPVDQNPVEFTNPNTTKNLSLNDTGVNITMTFTDNGFFINKDHNARSINRFHQKCEIVLHRNAGHMAYCDSDGGLSWKAAMRGGNKDRNALVKAQALELIKTKMQQGSIKAAGNRASKFVGKVKGDISSAIDGVNNDVSSATKGGKVGLMKKMIKF